MPRPRKSLLPLAFLIGLFGMATPGPVHAPGAPGGIGHPPVVQLATVDPGNPRRRRRLAGRTVCGILTRAVTAMSSAAGRIRPAAERIRSRRARRHRLARGPPRSHAG